MRVRRSCSNSGSSSFAGPHDASTGCRRTQQRITDALHGHRARGVNFPIHREAGPLRPSHDRTRAISIAETKRMYSLPTWNSGMPSTFIATSPTVPPRNFKDTEGCASPL